MHDLVQMFVYFQGGVVRLQRKTEQWSANLGKNAAQQPTLLSSPGRFILQQDATDHG